MKRLILCCVALATALGLFAVPALAAPEQTSAAIEAPVADAENPSTDTPFTSAEDMDAAAPDQPDDIELMATVTATIECPRKIDVTASKSSSAKLYRTPTSTTVVHKYDYYSSNVTLYCDAYVLLSDGSMRYRFVATNGGTGETLTYYIVKSSKTTETYVYHNFMGSTAHPHILYCPCGASDASRSPSVGCIQCYPSTITYDAGENASNVPAAQTVSSSPFTVSPTIPRWFPNTFLHWNSLTFDSNWVPVSKTYYPRSSYSISANTSLTLYSVWIGPTDLVSDGTLASFTVSSPGSPTYFSFVPEVTDTYVFQSHVSGDTAGRLYDANGTQLAYDDQSGDDSNFLISYNLTAGTQYYYQAYWYSSTATGKIDVSLRRQHTLTYDANGGEGAPSAQSFLENQSFQLSYDTPFKDCLQFVGWADTPDASAAQYFAGESFSAAADRTLYAVWTYPSGSCGENATWTFRDGTLYIEGSGAMTNYTSSLRAPWHVYASQIQNIEIAQGITSIGSYAFSDCTAFSSLNLPSTVTSIGSYAFYGCSSLNTLAVPSGVPSIEAYTFYGCSSLKSVILPQSVSSIGSHAFFDCSTLKELSLPASVGQLGEYAFGNCTSLASINIPNGISKIPAHCFDGCSQLSQLAIPGTVKTIGEFSFSGCSTLTEMIVPSSVTAIERGAFSQCTALTTVTIPDSVTTIGTSIFAYITDNVTVRCYLDTPIYQYAKDNGIAYTLMSWGALESPTFTRTETSNGATIALSAPKGQIYYTIDGSTPTTASTLYTAPIVAQKNFTIKAIAVCEGWDNSPVTSFDTAIPKVSQPVASIESGSHVLSGTKIALSCETEGAVIWCTTDGSLPTAADVYTGPITITEDTTIYALAVKNGMLNSSLVYLTYELTIADTTPAVTTLDATSITHNSAMVSASLESSKNVTSVQFVYYEKNNSKVRYTVEADANYRAVLTGLTPNTEYWFFAKACNDVGWGSGHVCSFMTEPGEDTKPMSITLDPTYLTLNKGKSKTILATILPLSADNREVYWSSEDTSVATVDANGKVTAVGLGNTRIKATTLSNRLVAYCNVDVISTEIAGTFDFSELNMITNSSSYDAHGYSHGVNTGGNALMASAYLARWDGVVLESNDPYPSGLASVKYKELDAEYHVQNILYLPYRSSHLDNDEIKNAVMKYGAVYTAFKVNYSYFSDNQTNYYLPVNVNRVNGGHAVAIVGWDDNYPATKFSVKAPGNGAFICKNSWGTESGEDGYFYISYYDKFLARATCGDFNAVFYDLQGVDNYNKIYQYDYLGPVAAKSFSSKKAYISNVFPESGKTLAQDELLEAVSFYNYSPGTAYDVYVVPNYVDKTSLRNLGESVASGTLEYAGYFTVDLDNPIQLKAGSRFAVVVQYHSPGSNTVIFVETPTTINIGGTQVPHSANARANADESYISNNGKNWTDCTSWAKNTNVCLKAFTSTEEDVFQLQGIDNLGRPYEDDTVYSFSELSDLGFFYNPAIEDSDAIILMESDEDTNFGSVEPSILPDLNTNNNYSEGAAFPARYDLRQEGCMTSVKNQRDIGSCWAHATYASMESAIKKATSTSSALSSDGLSQAGGNATSIELSHDFALLPEGSTQQLVATLLPYGNETPVVWSSSNNQIASVSAHGLVTAHGTGTVRITASTPDGSVVTECSVTVKALEALRFLTIDNLETELLTGNSLLLNYTCYPSNVAADLVWEVSDPSVARIDEYGLLTALKPGIVTVTISNADGTVSGEFVIRIVGRGSVTSEISSSTLTLSTSAFSGNLSLNVTNTESAARSCQVLVVFYNADGQMLTSQFKNVTLAAGSNSVSFSNLSMTGIQTPSVTTRIFVLDTSDGFKPLAETLSNITTK